MTSRIPLGTCHPGSCVADGRMEFIEMKRPRFGDARLYAVVAGGRWTIQLQTFHDQLYSGLLADLSRSTLLWAASRPFTINSSLDCEQTFHDQLFSGLLADLSRSTLLWAASRPFTINSTLDC
ncbi:hypothetical protein BgiMline_003070 [Biomphalaria glabrata]